MAQLTIAPVTIPPGAERHSATRTIPAITRDVSIQLTDSGDWTTVTGNILIWGVQVSRDSGATWDWLVWQPGRDDPTNVSDGLTLPFGLLTKNGGLPTLGVAASDVLADAGHLVRLAIRVDTAITLGATISTV